MRVSPLVLALGALAALGACNRVPSSAKVAIPAADPAQTEPQLAVGLWRQRVSGPQGVSVTRYCLDQAAAASLASFNQQLGGRCSEHQMALQSDGAWRFKTTCDTRLGAVTTQGSMRGDFAAHYVVQAAQQSVRGTAHMTADVERLGDCPAGMQPGDVILPDGSKGRVGALDASA